VSVPILSIQPGDSPRLNGEDKAHIARLAEIDAELPPILVDRRTMRVVDGMHRLLAASLQGHETINVIFFNGSDADRFLRAVEENVTHGLPLSQADRRAAAERIIELQPQMSDRAIGRSTGLAAKTVAAIRRRSAGDAPQVNARIGRDGKVRPLDSGDGRRRAAEILAEKPKASLRDVAKAAGISPATVLDVRKRVERGEPPVPARPDAREPDPRAAAVTGDDSAAGNRGTRPAVPIRGSEAPPPAATVDKLLRDPSLRNSDSGRQMLRLLQATAVGADQLPDLSATLPPHCVLIVAQLARQYAQMWHAFATGLSQRARVIDPAGQH
jgi:ParB-like chromosome segregation protein Spo0J